MTGWVQHSHSANDPTTHDQPFINPENLPYPDIGSRYKGNIPSARALVLELAHDTGRVNLVQSHVLGLL